MVRITILIRSLLLCSVMLLTFTGGTARASAAMDFSSRIPLERAVDIALPSEPSVDECALEPGGSIPAFDDKVSAQRRSLPAQQDDISTQDIPIADFETGTFQGWQVGGEMNRSVTSARKHSGNNAALLGDPAYDGCHEKVPVGSAWMRRPINVPPTGEYHLSFWFRMFSTDAGVFLDGKSWDTFDVLINGNLVTRQGNPSNEGLNCNKWWDSGWRQVVISVAEYRGQTVTLELRNINFKDGWHNTYTYVDDVAFVRPETIGWMALEQGAGDWGDHRYRAYNTGNAVTQNWFTVGFGGTFSPKPRFFASLATYDGADSAELRHQGLAMNRVQIKVEEDTTRDAETVHTNERVAYLALQGNGLLTAGSNVIGEAGEISLSHALKTVKLSRSYSNPVVFAQPPSYNGANPSVLRITDVRSDRFTLFIQEAPDQDLFHTNETVSYLVLEAGSWRMPNGAKLEVGEVTTTATVGLGVANVWEAITFPSAFSNTPVVLSQVQTYNDFHFVKTRQTGASATKVSLAMEQDERKTGKHGSETIGWLALEPGTGEWGAFRYRAYYTPDAVTHDWYAIGFGGTFSGDAPIPRWLGNLATYNGPDSAHLRYQNLTLENVQIKAEEDTTNDAELDHATEQASTLALQGDGTLMAGSTVIGEVGQISLNHDRKTVNLTRSYSNPVVFAQPLSYYGGDPSVVRITDVRSNRFTLFVHEAPDKDGAHITETVSYLVLEVGSWQLPNGAWLEVGKITTMATVGNKVNNVWETIALSRTFRNVPIVLSQVQTMNEPRWLNTRLQNLSRTGFQVATEVSEATGMVIANATQALAGAALVEEAATPEESPATMPESR